MGAVQGASEDANLRMAKSVMALDAIATTRAEQEMKDDRSGAQVKLVAGLKFKKEADTWTDGARRDASVRTVAIEPYSAAYFAVLEALPELKPYVSALDKLEISGVRARLSFKDGGITTLSAAEVVRLVAEYRGR